MQTVPIRQINIQQSNIKFTLFQSFYCILKTVCRGYFITICSKIISQRFI